MSDLAGAPTELVDLDTGVVAGRARRSVWGATRWSGVGTPLGFTGQQYDAESGLSYNRFRYYNPVTASYTSSDPLGVGPNPASATAYVHNPLTWIDPLGLEMHFKGKGSSLKEQAKQVREAGQHSAARNQRTIAVGEDSAGNRFVGSSNGFDRGQREKLAELGLQRVPGSGKLHAEEELMRAVPDLKRVGTDVRAPCGPTEHNCSAQLFARGIEVE